MSADCNKCGVNLRDNSEKLVLSPRRCVSKELLDQMPMLSVSVRFFVRTTGASGCLPCNLSAVCDAFAAARQTRYHEVSIAKPFKVFHLMQLVEKSIQVGALFSPKLYVPKEIWWVQASAGRWMQGNSHASVANGHGRQQDRVKIAGVPLKIEAFQHLKQAVEKASVRCVLRVKLLTVQVGRID